MSGDFLKFKIWVSTFNVRSKYELTITVDKEDWENYSEQEREDYMYDEVFNNNCLLEWGYEQDE